MSLLDKHLLTLVKKLKQAKPSAHDPVALEHSLRQMKQVESLHSEIRKALRRHQKNTRAVESDCHPSSKRQKLDGDGRSLNRTLVTTDCEGMVLRSGRNSIDPGARHSRNTTTASSA